jgi:hypothetical protein
MQFIQKKNRRVLKPIKQTLFFNKTEKNKEIVVNVKKNEEVAVTPKKEKKSTAVKTNEVVEKNNLVEENVI